MNDIKVISKSAETFEIIKRAVDNLVDVIKPTYGPAGNKVIIASPTYFNPLVVDDGVQIARDFKLADPVENEVVKVIKEVAIRTNDRVGDGTTGALIMVQAIINEAARRGSRNGRKIELELRQALEEVRHKLTHAAYPIKSREELKRVALVSFDNEVIADMVADLYHKLGSDGVITIDKSPTMETSAEVSEGLTLDHGYISPYMVNNPERMEALLEKPYILLTDYRLTEANDILPILNKLAAAGKNQLLIIAENVEQHALATLVINQPHVMNPQTGKPGVVQSVAVTAPGGEHRRNVLEDIGILTGAKVFSEAKGDKLELAEITDLGRADRVIARRDETVIVKPKGKKENVTAAIGALKILLTNEPNENGKQEIQRRLAMFTNTIAVIKVGAPTENEQKALKYKVEDTVNSVRSAFKSGVVCGAGLALARLKTSSPILNEALKYPARQLQENMGMDETHDLGPEEAVNVVTGQRGDFLKVGVMDPVEVLIAGVESAVSIASVLLTSSGMIVETPKASKE